MCTIHILNTCRALGGALRFESFPAFLRSAKLVRPRRALVPETSRAPAAAQRLMALHRADDKVDFLSRAAVVVVQIDRDGDCLYGSIRVGLQHIGHHQSIFTVHRLRQLVREGCQGNTARNVLIGGQSLLEHLKVQQKTLGDLAHRTTLPGPDGWAGIEEAALLASQMVVVIEIWVASPDRTGYVLWFRAIGASSKTTRVARLLYNGVDHYDYLRVRPPC